MTIEVRRVSFAYGMQVAVNELTVSFGAGELTCIAGPNGSGKSTLLRLLARSLVPQSGEVLLDGKSLREWDPRAYARAVGYLPQTADTSFPLKAIDVVLSGRAPYLRRFDWEGEQDLDCARQALRRCDAEFLADRFLDEMSGGERKRVFLARVLAGSPRVILLDEPFAALDLSHIQGLLTGLRQFVRESGGTVILVSHELNWSSAYSDRIVMMNAGSIVADGPPAVVLTPALLEKYFGIRTQVVSIPGRDRPWIVPGI